ncbi:hypothetical protein DRJ17_07355 [Candidatus Woesearchaeota archaeon]|nr:MAG: hypothetical protein DRJ17_07355 [Candidatus Woesearchaeota archaeon]
MGIEIEINNLPHHASLKLIKLKGELDILGSKKLMGRVNSLFEEGNFFLIADLSNLEYINSSGVCSLLHCFNKTKKKGGFLKLVAVNEYVREVLEVLGVNRIIPIYSTLDEAISETK